MIIVLEESRLLRSVQMAQLLLHVVEMVFLLVINGSKSGIK